MTARKFCFKRTVSLATVALVLTVAICQAQSSDVLQQDVDVTIDAVGNADFTLKFSLPAGRWHIWKQSYGQNQSLLKRDLQHRFSALALRDFDLQSDDMNRTATFHFKADAAAEYRGSGTWEAELEKGMRSAKLADNLWQFTKTSTEEGFVAQQTYRVKLPERARNVMEATNEFNKPVLRYELPVTRAGNALLTAAAALGVLGLIAIAAALMRKTA